MSGFNNLCHSRAEGGRLAVEWLCFVLCRTWLSPSQGDHSAINDSGRNKLHAKHPATDLRNIYGLYFPCPAVTHLPCSNICHITEKEITHQQPLWFIFHLCIHFCVFSVLWGHTCHKDLSTEAFSFQWLLQPPPLMPPTLPPSTPIPFCTGISIHSQKPVDERDTWWRMSKKCAHAQCISSQQ